MARSFTKKGLRRDLNFSDIVNPQRSLENILSGLVDITGESFISEDLDAIREIRASTITNDDFLNITGAASTVLNESGNIVVYKPVIKLKNRFDIAEYTVGEPQFWGGDGLTSRYYESNQIDSNSANVFSGTPTKTDIFWEQGRFNFESKIDDSFKDIYGGAEFVGYFKPTRSGQWSFVFDTTIFFTFEFDDGSGNYVLLARKSKIDYNFMVNANTAGQAFLQLQSVNNTKNIMIGDIVYNSSIPQFADLDNPVKVISVDATNGNIGISEALSANVTIGTAFIFRFTFGGSEPQERVVLTPILRAYTNYKIRTRFWVPDESFVDSRTVREIEYTVSEPTTSGTYLNYKWLYSENYPIAPVLGTREYGDFKSFYHNRLLANGGTVGGNASYSVYESVLTTNTLQVTYSPPASLSSAIKQTKSFSFTVNSDILTIGITDGIEIGNIVFGAGINANTRVNDIAINYAVFLDKIIASTQSGVSLNFVDHRGLNTYESSATWSSGTNSITGLAPATTANIRIGDVVVCNGSPIYNTVLTVASTSVTTSKAFTIGSGAGINSAVFFYAANGLYNNSLRTYCTNVYSGITTAQSNLGSNTLLIDDNSGIASGQVVQFGSRIPTGTTVVTITPSGADFTITLSANITDDIPSGQLITFAPSGTTDSKEICFPPTDTSPPFTATELGLATTTARPSIEIAPVTGTGELKFVGLSANNVTTQTVTISDTYNRTISIKDGLGNTYSVLATTT
jgi:hypothetical protein